jgi:putative RecB family exonuclease
VSVAYYVEPTIEDVFLAELDSAIEAEEAQSGFPADTWMKSGARGCQDRAWWQANGPRFVRNFTDWYEGSPDVSVWVTPDGIPAIELGLTVKFGRVEVKMFIDLVLQIGTALVVVDLKSGAKSPESLAQIAIYACGLELAYGVRPRYGTWFMLRGVGKEEPKQYFLTPVDLSGYHHSIEWWSKQFTMFHEAACNGVFVARTGEHCKRCGVAYACPAVGGKDAFNFDPELGKEVTEWKKRTVAGLRSL